MMIEMIEDIYLPAVAGFWIYVIVFDGYYFNLLISSVVC